MSSSASPSREDTVGKGTASARTRFFSKPPAVVEYCQAFIVLGTVIGGDDAMAAAAAAVQCETDSWSQICY